MTYPKPESNPTPIGSICRRDQKRFEMARHLQRRSGVKKLMHVDEDDVASRIGEGGVRSGKEWISGSSEDLAPRPEWGDLRWRGRGRVGEGGVDTAGAIGGDRGRRRRSRGPEVRAREEERGRTAQTEIQKSTHDDGTSIMKCFINAINLIKKFRTRIPLDQIGPIKGKKIRSKIPLGLKKAQLFSSVRSAI